MGDRPVKNLGTAGNLVNSQTGQFARQVRQCLPDTVAGQTAWVGKQLRSQFVHPHTLAWLFFGGRGHDSYDSGVEPQNERTEVLLVVPTLGQRIEYLRETLTSIQDQEVQADVVLVTPQDATEARQLAAEFGANVLDDPGSLPAAINLGVEACGTDYAFVNWLNDDDLLTPGSLMASTKALHSRPEATVAFGSCRYIDKDGQELWVSKAGKWAPRVLGWGPDLIPQPGMLVRAEAWHRVGGLDTSYQLAFDLDLLLKLKTLGPLVNTGHVVSCFRWHADSLTVDDRKTNIAESERAKRSALSPTARKWAWTWEPPVRLATRAAAREVQRRARRLSGSTNSR